MRGKKEGGKKQGKKAGEEERTGEVLTLRELIHYTEGTAPSVTLSE